MGRGLGRGWAAFLLASRREIKGPTREQPRRGRLAPEMACRLTGIVAMSMSFQNEATQDARLQGDAANSHISSGTAGAPCSA